MSEIILEGNSARIKLLLFGCNNIPQQLQWRRVCCLIHCGSEYVFVLALSLETRKPDAMLEFLNAAAVTDAEEAGAIEVELYKELGETRVKGLGMLTMPPWDWGKR